jgi:integrase
MCHHVQSITILPSLCRRHAGMLPREFRRTCGQLSFPVPPPSSLQDALCLRTRRARRPTTQISELAYRQGTEVDGPDVSVLKKAGLPDIRFHDLRHTCATVLLSEGVNPKFVQELLGHEDIKLTLGTYSHFLPSMGDQIATAMKNVLG